MENEKLLKSIRKIVSEENETSSAMVQRGLLDVEKRLGGRIDRLDCEIGDMKKNIKNLHVSVASVEYNQNEMMKKMDGLAYKYEVEELRTKFKKRIRVLELKAGLKPS